MKILIATYFTRSLLLRLLIWPLLRMAIVAVLYLGKRNFKVGVITLCLPVTRHSLLADHCRSNQYHPPVFNIVSDRRGKLRPFTPLICFLATDTSLSPSSKQPVLPNPGRCLLSVRLNMQNADMINRWANCVVIDSHHPFSYFANKPANRSSSLLVRWDLHQQC